MALKKLKDFDPNYLEFGSDNIIGFKVYLEGTNEKIGLVKDILLSESGDFRYLVVDFGLWIFNKQVMLPIGCCRINDDQQRVHILGFNKKQTEELPEYDDHVLTDGTFAQVSAAPDNYQQLSLYELNDQDHPTLKLYQERLLAKRRDYTGKAVPNRHKATNQGEAVVEQEQGASEQPESVEAVPVLNQKHRCSACLIFNPVAGQSDSEQDLATIRRILEPKIKLDIRTTTPDVNPEQLAREAIEQGAEMIIVSGGDGTLSAAAGAVVKTEVPFGVISRGTANAFATALGIPTAIEAACETILDGTTRTVDAAYCNGKPMVLFAGIGFEAETVERADRKAKDRFGLLAYVLAGVQELRDFRSFETRIETDDKIVTLDAVAVTVANAAPPTSVLAQGPAELVIDDGLLDVTLVAPANSVDAITAAFNLLQSADSAVANNRSDTGYLRAKSVKVTTNPPQKVVLDGEMIGRTPVEVECVPGGLVIFVPAGSEANPVEKLEGLPNLQVELKEPEAGTSHDST